MSIATYDPSEVICSIGEILVSGYAEGTYLVVEMDEDAFTKYTGSGGEVARARNKNKGGTLTLTLMQTSPVNDLLSALQAADDLSGTGVRPVFIKDNLGTTKVSVANAWVKKMPAHEYAKELGTRVWVIDLGRVTQNTVGGAL